MKTIDYGITRRRVQKDGKVVQSAIDHVLIKKPEMVNDYSIVDITYSDHNSIVIDLNIGVPRNQQGLSRKMRDLRKIRANPQYFQLHYNGIAATDEININIVKRDDVFNIRKLSIMEFPFTYYV